MEQPMDIADLESFVLRAEPRHGGIVDTYPARIALAFLPGQPCSVSFPAERVDRRAAARALRNLAALPFETRAEIEPLLYAFYGREMEDGAGNFDTPQAQLDWEMDYSQRRDFADARHATRPQDVWALCKFQQVYVFADHRTGAVIVAVTGLAAWDGEHGVSLAFKDGHRIVAATQIDGYP